MAYSVAAEGKQRIPGSTLTSATVTPAGILHAVDADERVLCGLRIKTLVPFPALAWDSVQGIRCPRCREVAAAR